MLGKYNNNYFKCIAEFSRKKGGTYKNKEEIEIRVATIADVVTNLGVGRERGCYWPSRGCGSGRRGDREGTAWGAMTGCSQGLYLGHLPGRAWCPRGGERE